MTRQEAALELLRLDPLAARRAWTAAELPTDTPLGLALLAHERKDTAAVAALRDLLLDRDAPYERRLLAARAELGAEATDLGLAAAERLDGRVHRVVAEDEVVRMARRRADHEARRSRGLEGQRAVAGREDRELAAGDRGR